MAGPKSFGSVFFNDAPLEKHRNAGGDVERAGQFMGDDDGGGVRFLGEADDQVVDHRGKHRVEAAAPGYQPMPRDVQIPAGESATLALRLAPVAGSLVIIVPGGLREAEVRLDGLLVELSAGEKLGDRTPPMHVQAGSHRVVCARGTDESAHEVEVSANGVTEVTCTDIAPSTGTARQVLGWTGVGVGAGLVGAGAYGLLSCFLVDAEDPRYSDPSYQVSHNKVIFGSTYVALGVAAGVCSWLFLLRDSKPAESGR